MKIAGGVPNKVAGQHIGLRSLVDGSGEAGDFNKEVINIY